MAFNSECIFLSRTTWPDKTSRTIEIRTVSKTGILVGLKIDATGYPTASIQENGTVRNGFALHDIERLPLVDQMRRSKLFQLKQSADKLVDDRIYLVTSKILMNSMWGSFGNTLQITKPSANVIISTCP